MFSDVIQCNVEELVYFRTFPDIALSYHTSGRSEPGVSKAIVLFTALDPPNWNRALEAAQRAKSLGIWIGVFARGEDSVNEENFRKLSGGRLTVFGDEKQHLERIHELINTEFLCGIINTAEPVCLTSRSTATSYTSVFPYHSTRR